MPVFELSPDSPVLQPAYVRLLCDVLRKKGVDLGPTLQQAGLGDLNLLQSRDRPVSVMQVAALVATSTMWAWPAASKWVNGEVMAVDYRAATRGWDDRPRPLEPA